MAFFLIVNCLCRRFLCPFLTDRLIIVSLGAPPPWHGTKSAIHLSPVCPQKLPSLNGSGQPLTNGRAEQLKRLFRYLQDESEDCLFLNLYVPKWRKYGLVLAAASVWRPGGQAIT